MKKLKEIMLLALAGALLPACNGALDSNTSPQTGSPTTDQEWLIPINDVFNGGPGKDGIPSIDNPNFSTVREMDATGLMQDSDLVVGIKVGNEIRAYPHFILDWHEIVNDEIANLPIAVTYCPLTGTAVGWHRRLGGTVTTFGVSGLLYNTNLMPYDRNSDSVWSQMLLKSVNGSFISTEALTYPLLELTWGEWKVMFPNSRVLNTNTGFNRSYGRYPYGDYRTNNDLLLFPVTHPDDRLPRKERGLGVNINEEARFYRFTLFEGQEVKTINENFGGEDIVVVGSQSRNFIVAYNREIEPGVLLDFEPVQQAGEVVMRDNNGDRWTIFGEALEGPYADQTLDPVVSYIGMWFAWATFHPGIEIAQ